MGWNRDCLAVPLCSWAPAGLHFLTSLTVKCGHVTEFWPLIWEQKWWMLLPDLAYKNFTHGPPLSPFSYLLTECWGSRWSWESYVENVKALISLNSLVNAGSKPSPPFLWFQLNFEWEIQYLVLSHGDFTVYLLIQIVRLYYNVRVAALSLFLPIFQSWCGLGHAVSFWISFQFISFLFVIQNWFTCLQLKSLIGRLVVKVK